MTTTEIKKALYKQKPEATFIHARKSRNGTYLVYGCSLDENDPRPNLFFEVPVEELGDGLFGNTLGAQLLIRYMVEPYPPDSEVVVPGSTGMTKITFQKWDEEKGELSDVQKYVMFVLDYQLLNWLDNGELFTSVIVDAKTDEAVIHGQALRKKLEIQ